MTTDTRGPTQQDIRRCVRADPCDDCGGTDLEATDLQEKRRRGCYVAVVECDTCGHTHRRDIPWSWQGDAS